MRPAAPQCETSGHFSGLAAPQDEAPEQSDASRRRGEATLARAVFRFAKARGMSFALVAVSLVVAAADRVVVPRTSLGPRHASASLAFATQRARFFCARCAVDGNSGSNPPRAGADDCRRPDEPVLHGAADARVGVGQRGGAPGVRGRARCRSGRSNGPAGPGGSFVHLLLTESNLSTLGWSVREPCDT